MFHFLQKTRIEGPRQQFPDRDCLALPFEVKEFDGGVLAKLPDDLSAGAARRRQ